MNDVWIYTSRLVDETFAKVKLEALLKEKQIKSSLETGILCFYIPNLPESIAYSIADEINKNENYCAKVIKK